MKTPIVIPSYEAMTTQQRATHLLAQGVVAQLDIDPDTLTPGYAAHVSSVGRLPCGFHPTEEDAIQAGTTWLQGKAKQPESV